MRNTVAPGEIMSPIRALLVALVTTPLLAGCGGGNMFGSSSPALILEADTSPNVRELERTLPSGLLPDREQARHTGQSVPPQ